MNNRDYDDRRVELRTGALTPVERQAAQRLHGLMQSFVPYTPTICPWDAPKDEKVTHTLILGTLDKNPRLQALARTLRVVAVQTAIQLTDKAPDADALCFAHIFLRRYAIRSSASRASAKSAMNRCSRGVNT